MEADKIAVAGATGRVGRHVGLAGGLDPVPRAPIPEIAGPREERLLELAQRFVAHRGDALRIEAGGFPGDPDAELYASGALLPGPHATLAGPTFADWLDAQQVGN